MSKKAKKQNFIACTVLFIIGVLFSLPLLWLITAAFDTRAVVALAVPEQISLDNFREVFNQPLNISGFINSFFIGSFTAIIVLICSVMAAYPLSRYGFKASRRITQALLFMTALPGIALIIPTFQIFIALNLIDSLWGIVFLMSAGSLPFTIWMMKNFLDAVPVELEEAAWIDGASGIKTMRYVIAPLMIPGLFTVTVITFSGGWSTFFAPFILLQSVDRMPAGVNIFRFFRDHGQVVYGQLAAYSILYIIPVLVLYFFAQSYMSKGFAMSGATKG